nr:DMP19 family protein [uncultured Roseateles sp.]
MGGYRERIEAGKRQREVDRAYEQSAERKYWRTLVDRVHRTSEGFDGLRPEEKTYFAVSCLIGEVYNGGFDQFFSNSSGEMYGIALAGLWELEANVTAGLLLRAKEVLFGDGLVPVDRSERCSQMPTIGNDAAPGHKQLDELDRLFYEDPDKLGERCKCFAISNGLYADG